MRYCSVCGQENIGPHKSFAGIVKDFGGDILHFDGKFFITTKYLFTKPGFLSKEYSIGKRTCYFHPIRMYLFTSALFFFVFFAFFVPKEVPEVSLALPKATDSIPAASENETIDTGTGNRHFSAVKSKMTEFYAQGDSAKYMLWAVVDKFLHRLPYLLFISLPVYAFYLMLLYWRNKQFYYSDHAVFLIHLYIFTFILLIALMALIKLLPFLGIDWIGPVYILFLFYATWYAYQAMHWFYGGSKNKALFKFTLFNILSLLSLFILFGLFLGVTLLQVSASFLCNWHEKSIILR